MHVSAHLKATAFLSVIFVPALGAVTGAQISTQLQDMNTAVQNTINDASTLSASTLVDEVDSITTNLGDFNLEIPGSDILSIDEQNNLGDSININALLLTATFEVTIPSIDDGFSEEDKTAVDNSAIDLMNTYGDTVAALGQLGPTIEGMVPGVEAELAEAIEAIKSS